MHLKHGGIHIVHDSNALHERVLLAPVAISSVRHCKIVQEMVYNLGLLKMVMINIVVTPI